MAQTKTPTKKAKAKRATSTSGSKSRAAGTGSKARSSRSKASNGSKASSSRPKRSTPSARRSSGNGSSSHGVADGIKSARETVEDASQKTAAATGKAAVATGKAVSKAKVPLIAGSAALLGVAGGFALNSTRSKGPKVLGVKVPKTKVKIRSKDLAKAADRVAGAGEQIGRVSTGYRELQGTNDHGGGNGRQRSPLEVVIEGLTRRH